MPMPVRVSVLYGGSVAEAAGSHREEVEVPEGSTVWDVIRELVKRHGPRLQSALSGRVLVLLNGRTLDASSLAQARVSDGDFISILPPISGGSGPRLLDTSALVKYLAGEEGWERVAPLLEGSYTLDVAVVEVANVLARRVRSARLTAEAARRALSSVLDGSHGLTIVSSRGFLEEALDLSSREDITVQDALFVVAALGLRAELVTADSRQAEVAARQGVPVSLV